METYNLTYDKLQKKIVEATNKHFLDDLTSPAFIGERVTVTHTKRNLGAISATKLAFAGATKSNMDYLMVENKN